MIMLSVSKFFTQALGFWLRRELSVRGCFGMLFDGGGDVGVVWAYVRGRE